MNFNRFATLGIDSDSETDNKLNSKTAKNQSNIKSNTNLPNNAGNKKKRNRKKKKPTTELKENIDQEEWIRHDEELVNDLFHNDLKKALELSKLEFEKQHQVVTNSEFGTSNEVSVESPNGTDNKINKIAKREKKKKEKEAKTISLEKFLQSGDSENITEHNNNKKKSENKSKSHDGENFFKELEKEAEHIKRHDDNIKKFKESVNKQQQKSGKLTYKELTEILAKKDKVIENLESCVELWKKKHEKMQNKFTHLSAVVQKGELKESCKMVIEIERLSNVRNELTAEITDLNVHLEQEKSKNSKLKEEIVRLQGKKEH